jgi:putative ABC transport system permease protein
MVKTFLTACKKLLQRRSRALLILVGIALFPGALAGLPGSNRDDERSLNKDRAVKFQLMVMAGNCPYEAATLMLKGGAGLRYMKSVMASIAREPEVEEVTPILTATVFDPNRGESGGTAEYVGIEARSFAALKPFLRFRQGGWFPGEDTCEVVMGCQAAELEQREAGDMILIPEKNIRFTVAGILERTGTRDDGTIFMPLRTLEKIFGMPEKITTAIGIKVKKGADCARLEEKLSRYLTHLIPVAQEAPRT